MGYEISSGTLSKPSLRRRGHGHSLGHQKWVLCKHTGQQPAFMIEVGDQISCITKELLLLEQKRLVDESCITVRMNAS